MFFLEFMIFFFILHDQFELYATQGNAYKFLFMAKGGGSAN